MFVRSNCQASLNEICVPQRRLPTLLHYKFLENLLKSMLHYLMWIVMQPEV